MQIVELLYRNESQCNYRHVLERAQQILKDELECPQLEAPDKILMFLHKAHVIKYKEGEIPAQTVVMEADRAPTIQDHEKEIQQSWRCPEASELVQQAKVVKMVTEMMARSLAPAIRLELFHGVLQAMIEVTQPTALVFKHTQQVITPAQYLEACSREPLARPGSINIRFFNISNSPGDMIMDTLGLDAIGLHDLQCHYRELDPNDVSYLLYNTAHYIFEKGPVIESGQTVEGIKPNTKWKCQFEESMLEPKRELLDINPGPPFAAGGRK